MENKPVLLIVEDDHGLQKQLKWALKSDYDILFADNKKKAWNLLNCHSPRVIVHDLGLPPDSKGVSEGKASIESILKHSPKTKIIVMTGKGDRQDAVEMISLGAHDFFSKPVESETLKLIIERAFFLSDLENKVPKVLRSISDSTDENFVLPGMVGNSEVMQKVSDRVHKVAKTSASVFIYGQSGTGKELIAKAIHNLSDRHDQPFVAINCAAIPESLLESELFGYEKGAFTGAAKRTLGKIEQAQKGTLFLDEIGDMAYDLQSKILRFLQERVLNRVGGNEDIPIDIRVITATHQHIPDMIQSHQFREDLFYRINEIEVYLPELARRGDDILLIARYLLGKFSESHGKKGLEFSADALNAIKNAQWQGNIRQLSNLINKAVILTDNELITEDTLDITPPVSASMDRENYEQTLDNIPSLKQVKEDAEVKLIVKAMKVTNNNVNEASRHLGITRQRVYSLLKKHKILIKD